MHKPSPPVPQKLREMLRDYPEHIARLQEALDSYVQKPILSLPFDGAVWALEGRLETFIAEARDELRAAEAASNAQTIERAEAKELLMLRARSGGGGMMDLNELWDYCERYKDDFK